MSWTNGTKVPGSEMARERIGQGSIGQFVPGSELARERKGCESKFSRKTSKAAGCYFL